MALTEIYVDPSIDADSGAGTIGDPYGDLEYAIEQETFDTTNGTRINIKAGTDEVLAAPIEDAMADTSVSVAWSPSSSAPLVIQGYTSVAGDLGVGGISGGGSVGIFENSLVDNAYLVDLHLHNTGSNPVIHMRDNIVVCRCEVEDTTDNAIEIDDNSLIIGCYVHNFGLYGINTSTDSYVTKNYVEVNAGNSGIRPGAQNTITRNIVVLGASGNGIRTQTGCIIDHNSVYAEGSSSYGIDGSTGTFIVLSLANNLIEGFSGSGGVGINFSGANRCRNFAGNSVYDCETEYDLSGLVTPQTEAFIGLNTNETLSASPFTDAANGDFSPVDTGDVKEGSEPSTFNGP